MADILYCQPPGCDGLKLSALPSATHRKQLIYAGNFTKREGGRTIKFSVTPEVLDHWAKTGNEMIAGGVAVPMPLEHRNADNPEMRRGSVVQFERGYDSRGRDALFAHFNFTSDEAAASLSSADVSVFVPEAWTDTGGREYKYPIRHVAFTDYPVIPGLDPHESLAASFDPNPERDMSLRKLAEKLGIEVAADATDDQLLEKLEGKYAEQQSQQPVQQPPAQQTQQTPAQNQPPSQPVAAGEAGRPTPLAASFAKLAAENRVHSIDGLVRDGHVTPASADALKAQYAKPDTLALSLSDDGQANDGFDGLVAALKLNKALNLSGGRSGGQQPQGGDQGGENVLLKNAKARAGK